MSDTELSTGGRGALRLLVPLRHRDFRLLWIGMTVSLVGDGLFLVAMAWQVYELSDAPAALGFVGAAMTVPHVVFLLVGGVVSDRFDRRRIMIGADILRGAAVALLGVLALSGTLELWHMLVVVAAYGAGTAFFGPAFDAIVPDLVPEDLLVQANALDQVVRPAAWHLVGPAVGGWIIAVWGTGGAFIADALTFAVSVVAIALMRSRVAAASGDAARSSSVLSDVREGFAYVRSQVWLWGTFLAATIAYLLFWGPMEVLLPYLVKHELGGGPAELGYILAAGGVGAVFAALLMGARDQPRRPVTFIYTVWTISTLAVAGYGLAHSGWQAMVASFAFNAFEAAGTIVWATTKQRLVPGRLLGRVSSFDWLISTALLPVSFALAGPVAQAFGARAALVGAGVIGGLITLGFLFLPGMRAPERAPAPGDVSEQPVGFALEAPAA
jgi:DHA3 family tetracycline resistance protein-like MFS transporter